MPKFVSKKPAVDKIRYHEKDRVERGEFRGATATETIMPDTILILGESAFRECKNLRSVTLSNKLCEIGAYAFTDCSALENILMPGEMRYPDCSDGSIGIGAFEGCSSLREITIPAGIRVIPANAFRGCLALEAVTFPRSLRAIQSSAFEGCAKLRTIQAKEMPELIAHNAFKGTPIAEQIASSRPPVLTLMHSSTFAMPKIFQFSVSPRVIGQEQTDGEMSLTLDSCDAEQVSFRITGYTQAGGQHTIPFGKVSRIFHEEYEVNGRAGAQREEIIASYR